MGTCGEIPVVGRRPTLCLSPVAARVGLPPLLTSSLLKACGVLGAPPWWCGVDGVALLASVSLTFRHLPVIWLL